MQQSSNREISPQCCRGLGALGIGSGEAGALRSFRFGGAATGEHQMKKHVPALSLITATPEEGRALAITLARHSIHAMQHEEEVLKSGRAQYANDPHWLIAASHGVRHG